MANITRSSKPSNDWTSNDLAAYNITVLCQSTDAFFGYTPNTIPDGIDPDFLTATIVPPNCENLSDHTYRLLQYLDIATHAGSNQESAINDFAKELLSLLGFEERGTVLRLRYSIPFMICGDDGRVAQTNLCLVQGNTTILLVIQNETAIGTKNPEAQVIAEAIAAFQYNNVARDRNGLDPLDSMTIPAITMISTRPVFYKIPVTQQLSNAIAMAQCPVSKTEIVKCVVAPHSCRLSEGMEVPEFRQEVLQHYEAFRRMSKECWSHFIV
ncbi:uncharacterized protein EV420DRAFT_100107 [Desarmillaria tabescens]|uniref:Uncharacterized protein n=1 Tax=Armillaria tabescens TaxID=1929756 RepID=A0AA39NR34_ARMTA|nr:uncharacterized protein EV420DRAFT_100107 [Desarmillaria tabescens]KAK0470241.1 hypothetical protein EV420DRAFT_100107 [Desarmillaria tabescens]